MEETSPTVQIFARSSYKYFSVEIVEVFDVLHSSTRIKAAGRTPWPVLIPPCHVTPTPVPIVSPRVPNQSTKNVSEQPHRQKILPRASSMTPSRQPAKQTELQVKLISSATPRFQIHRPLTTWNFEITLENDWSSLVLNQLPC